MSDTKLKNFKGFKAEIHFDEIIDEYADRCCDILHNTSPVGRSHQHYKDGWTVDKRGKKHKDTSSVVWNETDYQLTHLLENGHLIVNKRDGVGWASPHPHIERAYQQVKEPFIRDMTKVDIELK